MQKLENKREKMEKGFQKARDEENRMKQKVSSCPFRMRYHIMPPVGWLNDPNGLCRFQGEFHAYFQYSPLSVHGGGGYWGHCVSKDLLHWEYREPVLTTDTAEDRSGVYSGSSLIENDTMYLFYTGNVKLKGAYDYIDAGRISSQLMVESRDGQNMSEKEKVLGMEDYPDDITQHVRDPKVWKENGSYYMVLGVRARAWDSEGDRRDKGGILVYRSEDKKHWQLEHKIVPAEPFGYMWECPDIFTLDNERVLSFCPQGLEHETERFQNIYQAGYSLLNSSENPADTFCEWDMGFDFYAPQTFDAGDGRRILIGWAGLPEMEETHRNLTVENGWQHCLTLPTELILSNGKIRRIPVRELDALKWQEVTSSQDDYCWTDKTVRLEITQIGTSGQSIRIGTETNALNISVQGNKTEITFLNDKGTPMRCGGGRDYRIGHTEKSVEKLLVLLDSSIAEIFVNDGELAFTTRIYLETSERRLQVTGTGLCRLEMICGEDC